VLSLFCKRDGSVLGLFWWIWYRVAAMCVSLFCKRDGSVLGLFWWIWYMVAAMCLSLFCKRDGSVLGLFCKRDGSNVQAPSIPVSLMCCVESRLTISRVAATCRRSKFLDLFGKTALFSKGSFAEKTPQCREPTSRVAPSHTHPRRHYIIIYIYIYAHTFMASCVWPHVCTCCRLFCKRVLARCHLFCKRDVAHCNLCGLICVDEAWYMCL